MATGSCSPKEMMFDLQLANEFRGGSVEKGSEDEPPLLLAGHGVRGRLHVAYNDPTLTLRPRDIIKISLEGRARVMVPSRCHDRNLILRCSQLQYSFLDLVDVTCIGSAVVSPNGAYVDFNFDLPSVVSYSKGSSQSQVVFDEIGNGPCGPLPSSLSAHSIVTTAANSSPQKIHAKIEYTLRVQAYRHSESTGSVAKTLRIYNDVDIQPPTFIGDFPSEFQSRQLRPLRRNFRKTGVVLLAVAREPSPLVFYSNRDSASTKVPIEFEFHTPYGKAKDDLLLASSLETIDATVTWRLKAVTFLSRQPLTSMPTMVQSRTDPSLSMILNLGQRHMLKLSLKLWNQSLPGSCLTRSSSSSTFESTIQLLVMVTKAILPTPPMLTPCISRRYSIVMQVKLASRSSGQACLQLQVPVQIAYQQDKDSPSIGELPPTYDNALDMMELDNDKCETMESPIYSP